MVMPPSCVVVRAGRASIDIIAVLYSPIVIPLEAPIDRYPMWVMIYRLPDNNKVSSDSNTLPKEWPMHDSDYCNYLQSCSEFFRAPRRNSSSMVYGFGMDGDRPLISCELSKGVLCPVRSRKASPPARCAALQCRRVIDARLFRVGSERGLLAALPFDRNAVAPGSDTASLNPHKPQHISDFVLSDAGRSTGVCDFRTFLLRVLCACSILFLPPDDSVIFHLHSLSVALYAHVRIETAHVLLLLMLHGTELY